jgi:hypothetical protein
MGLRGRAEKRNGAPAFIKRVSQQILLSCFGGRKAPSSMG